MAFPAKALIAMLLLGLVCAGPARAEEPRYYVYAAQQGDTLLKLSNRFLIKRKDWQSIAKLNNISETTRIPVGTKIRIPMAAMRAEQSGATVIAVQGQAEAGNGLLEKNTNVAEGAKVKTGEGAFVTLRMADGSTLTVQPKSQVVLTSAKQYANTGGLNDTIVKLEAGRVESTVAKQRQTGARYEVRTATSNMGVRGTVFRAGSDETGKRASSEVIEGAVGVAGTTVAGPELPLPAGFGTIAEAGKAPLPPIELLPPPDLAGLPAQVHTADFRFRFAAIPKSEKYRAQIARDKDFKDVVAEAVSVEPAAAFSALTDGAYFVRVRGIDNLGLEGRDAVQPVAVEVDAGPPSGLKVVSAATSDTAAKQGAAVLTRSPFSEFTWSPVEGARRYHFQVAKDEQFAVKVIDDPSITEGRFQSKIPLPSGNYWWRVASIGPSGRAGAFSVPQAFLVAANLRLEKVIVDGSRATISWNGIEGGEYELQVASDEYFRKIVKEVTVRKGTAQLEDLPRGAYFARVRLAGGAKHFGAWSELEPFEVFGKGWLLNVLPH